MTLRLPCALDRAQVGPERFGSKGTNHNSYRSIQLNAGRREISIRRLRRARAVLAACGVLADGNRVLAAPGTADQGGRGKAAGSPSRTRASAACLIGSLRAGQKVPSKAGLGAISRQCGTPASGGRYSRWHPQRVERFQPLYKLRDNGPNSASGSPNQAEDRI